MGKMMRRIAAAVVRQTIVIGRRSTSTLPRAAVAAAHTRSSRPHSQANEQLNVVSQAIKKVLEDKAAAFASSELPEGVAPAVTGQAGANAGDDATEPTNTTKYHDSERAIKVKESCALFENAVKNAQCCVSDVAEVQNQEQLQEEINTAEQALTNAQAAYLDLLDVLRLETSSEDMETTSLSVSRDEAASLIRKLRQQLDALQKHLPPSTPTPKNK